MRIQYMCVTGFYRALLMFLNLVTWLMFDYSSRKLSHLHLAFFQLKHWWCTVCVAIEIYSALNIHIAHFPAILCSVLFYCCLWLLSYHYLINWLHLNLVHHSFMGVSNERICEWYKTHKMAINSQSNDLKSVLLDNLKR